MLYSTYTILKKIQEFSSSLLSHYTYLKIDRMNELTTQYAEQVKKNPRLNYKIETTTDPETFNFRAARLLLRDWGDWSILSTQSVFGLYDGVFIVSLYKPDLYHLHDTIEMMKYLPKDGD